MTKQNDMVKKNCDNVTSKEQTTPGCYIKARYTLAVMLFAAVFNMFSTRSNLNIAIVAMVNSTNGQTVDNQSDACPVRSSGNATTPSSNGVFLWNSADQGLLLSSYYYGYVITNVPGAWLSQRFGFSKVVLVACALTTVLTLLTPIVSYQSFELLLALRIFLGLVQGPILPSAFGSWKEWAPTQEQSTLIATTFSATSIGNCFTLAFSGLIAAGLGWEGVFYLTGGISGFTVVLWFFFVYDSPDDHPRISEEEKCYIKENSSGGISNTYRRKPNGNNNSPNNQTCSNDNVTEQKESNNLLLKVPWISIFTSRPLWAMVISHFCLNYGSYTLSTMLPTYMSTVLMYDIASSGLLSALPYILEWLFMIGTGLITDLVQRRKLTSTTVVRKTNTTISELVPALFVVLAGYIGCNSAAAVSFFTLAVGFHAVSVGGCRANAADIAPAYSGIVFSISNTFANTPGFIAPLIAGTILEIDNSVKGWQTIFWISAGVHSFGAVVFLLLGSGKEQKWAKVEENLKQLNEGAVNSAFEENTQF